MKKFTSILIVVVISLLIFCSCGQKINEKDAITQSEITSETVSKETVSESNKKETIESENSKVENIESAESVEFEEKEITLENYKEYFEIKEHFYAYKDEFGDYTGRMSYGVYLCLKQGYEADTSYGKSNVKVKFKNCNSSYGFSFNEKTAEGKRLELIDAYSDVYTFTESFSDFSNDKGLEDLNYAAEISGGLVDIWPTKEGGFGGKYKYSVSYPENLDIIGMTGTLYVRKK